MAPDDPRSDSRTATPTVLHTLTDPDIAHAHRLVDAARAADGVAPLSEQAVMAIDAGADENVRHIVSADGYANILAGRDGEPAMIEAVVDPDRRCRGSGRALLDVAFTAASDLSNSGVLPRAWAHGDLPGAVALAASMGLVRTRELLQLRRAASEPLPPLEIPTDVVLRTYAGHGDDAEILRVNNAAFDWHPEQGGWSHEQIDERVEADWFDPAGLFLAFDAADPATLLGFHWTKVAEPGLGEVYIVGVDPAAQGRGLGKLLTLAGLHHMDDDRGVDAVMLYVEGDNAAALHTYDRLAFTRANVDVAYGRR